MAGSNIVGTSGDFRPADKRLTDLPEEILVRILGYCDGVDILNLAETFRDSRLSRVIRDPTLWVRSVIGPGDLKTYMKYLGSHTTSLTILGNNPISRSKKRKKSKVALSEAVISSISLRCSSLKQFTIKNCVIDTNGTRFSLFPKTITHLTLDSVSIVNLPQVKEAHRSSPFFCIKKCLPQLHHLSLIDPSSYLTAYDSLALISGCTRKPSLKIDGEDHHYTFEEEGQQEETMTRDSRRDTRKLFGDLVMYHYIKKRYDTRQPPPS